MPSITARRAPAAGEFPAAARLSSGLKRPAGADVRSWVNYVTVASVDAALERAQGLGARVTRGKSPVPGMGWFAMLVDPQGNSFAIWQDDSKAQ